MNRRYFTPPHAVFALTAVFMACFLVWPVCVTVREAFVDPQGGFTFAFVKMIFSNPIYQEGLWNSFKMAVGTTIGSMCLALPLAVLATRFEFRGKVILTSLLLVPLILPPFVGVIGVKQILGQDGALNALLIRLHLMDPVRPMDWLGSGRLMGVIIMNSLHLYPILYLNITAALSNLDPALDEAAENLGCTPWRRFRRVTLPLAMPGIFAGASIVFIWGFTELGVPLTFDYHRVTSVQIFDGIKEMGGNPLPYALVTIMVLFSALFFIISKYAFGRQNFAGSGRASMAASTVKLTGWRGFWAAGGFITVILLAVMPHIGVFLTACAGDWNRTILPKSLTLDHYRDALSHSLTVPSIQNSLQYAGIATVLACVLGVAISWVCVRTKLAGRHLLDALTMMPLAVPGIVLAFGYLAMTRGGQPFDWLMPDRAHNHWHREFSWLLPPDNSPVLLLIIAYCIRRLPYVVRSASAGLQQTSVSLEEAAQNLGCSPAKTIRKITLPLIAGSLIAGALLAFSFSMLEVSDSMIIAQQREHYPITKTIYELIGNLGNGEALAAALGVWAMIFLTITLVGASMILGKKLGALFRV